MSKTHQTATQMLLQYALHNIV